MNAPKHEPFRYTTREITCPRHGKQMEQGFSTQWFGCPECAKVAHQAQAAKNAELAKQKLYSNASIPVLFDKAGFENYDTGIDGRQQAVFQRVRKYLTELREGSAFNLVLAGKTGTGKTHLGCALLRNLTLRYGIKSRYITGADFAAQIRQSWDHKIREIYEHEIIGGLGAVPVLMIDELGVSDYLSKTDSWSNLIDRRYRNNLPTIITTNLTEAELMAYIGDRAADRLLSRAILAECEWESYRQIKGRLERVGD